MSISINTPPPSYDNSVAAQGLALLSEREGMMLTFYPKGSTVLYDDKAVTIDSWVSETAVKLTTGQIVSTLDLAPTFHVGDQVLVSDYRDEDRRYFSATVTNENPSRLYFQWNGFTDSSNQPIRASISKTGTLIKRILPKPADAILQWIPSDPVIMKMKNGQTYGEAFPGYKLEL